MPLLFSLGNTRHCRASSHNCVKWSICWPSCTTSTQSQCQREHARSIIRNSGSLRQSVEPGRGGTSGCHRLQAEAVLSDPKAVVWRDYIVGQKFVNRIELNSAASISGLFCVIQIQNKRRRYLSNFFGRTRKTSHTEAFTNCPISKRTFKSILTNVVIFVFCIAINRSPELNIREQYISIAILRIRKPTCILLTLYSHYKLLTIELTALDFLMICHCWFGAVGFCILTRPTRLDLIEE